MSRRSTPRQGEVESVEINALVDEAKRAEREGRWSDASARYEALVRNPFANDETRLCALRWLGRAYLEQGNRGAAIDVLEAAVAAATQAGSKSAIAHALNVVAIVHQTGGDLDRAETMYTEARQTAESIGDAEALAMIDQNLGTVASIRGDMWSALEAFHRSLEGYRKLGMRDQSAQVLNNIGLAYSDLGQLDRAETAYTEAEHTFGEEQDETNKLNVALNQVQLCIATGRFDEAMERAEPLLALTGEIAPSWRGEVFRHVGVIARERGDYVKAAEYLGRACECADESEDLLLKADVTEQLAELYWTQKRHRDMLANLNQSHALYSRLKAQHRVVQVERRNAALEARFLEMAHQWGDSIESKDHYTQGHCQRVAFFACVLADSAGMDSRSLFWFRLGALLHDIGKIIVPTEVLNKTSGLSEEEWAIMKRHPEAGLELVSDIDFPGDVRAIIRNHHERWDGTGYPDKLSGEEIPFAARILCVADVYDALTTPRSYRDGLSHARAAEMMRAQKGQFDPYLLDTFLEWAGAMAPERKTPAGVPIFVEGGPGTFGHSATL
ncbi:MAG TPA: HD domain-containing phosphohydrolase [Gemmatimonadaceae bacterium]|jgi:putative nucleotidyltransferase with HDIG domain|nr:HD domain-containing phosphohydrolase [Gemmatimonadaceae bacterium]